MKLFRLVIAAAALLATQGLAPTKGLAQSGLPFSIEFEALGGTFQWADSAYIWDEEFVGGALSLGFGEGVALRGYYWEGLGGDFTSSGALTSWGGEIRFDLKPRSALRPYFVIGAGELRFQSEYSDKRDLQPKNSTTVNVGGGLAWKPFGWLRLGASARDLILRTPEPTDPSVQPLESEGESQRTHNFQLQAQVSFILGGRSQTQETTTTAQGQPTTVVLPSGAVVAGAAVGAAVAADPGSVDTRNAALRGETAPSDLFAEQAVRSILAVEVGYLDARYPGYAPIGEERVPINRERADTLGIRVAQRMHEAFDFVVEQEVAAILAALDRELDGYNVGSQAKRRILGRSEDILKTRLSQVQRETSEAVPELIRRTEWERAELERRRRLAPLVGGSFGQSAMQLVIGGQVGLGTPWSEALAFVPEVQIGMFDGGSTVLVQGGLRYFWTRDTWQPYGGLGIGLLVASNQVGDRSGSEVVFNPVFGVEFLAPSLSNFLGQRAVGWFVEYQGVDFFQLHRVLVGLNWGF